MNRDDEGLSRALEESERRRRETQRLSGVGFWELDHQQQSLYWSEEIFRIYELDATQVEPDYALFLSLIYDDDRELVETAYNHSVQSGEEYNIRYRVKAGGRAKWIEARGVTSYDEGGAPVRSIGTARDISEIVGAQEQIEHLAYHDALTDLPNRQLFSSRLSQAIERAHARAAVLAVLFIDLDNFKLINDRHGHDIGDEVLVGVAQELRRVTDRDCSFARIGGDEFAGVLSGIEGDDPEQALRQVKRAIDRSYATQAGRFDVTASIGVALYPRDSEDPDILLRHADQAMYEAKELGKSRISLFNTERFRSSSSRRRLLRQLETALGDNQLALHYQPRVDLRTGSPAGAEALLRWFSDDGLVPPANVITAIKGTTLEWELDRWVIEHVLAQSHAYRERGIPGPFSLNINPSSIENPEFPTQLASLLQRAGVSGEELEIEILETSSITNFDSTNDVLHRCKLLGIGFSLDDFGTGFSSLTHFHALPIDKLKIDQRFIRSLNSDASSLTLVKSILALAKANQRPVIAEGVESHAIARLLAELGCEYGQGHGIARPLPPSEYLDWFARWDAAAFVGRLDRS